MKLNLGEREREREREKERDRCIKWHIIENSSFCGGVGACAASFFEERL